MSRVTRVSSSSSSVSLQKEQPDQKKIYMDWANHYLRKAHYTDVLSDLHQCVQGNYLPKIIHAVVQSSVPGITVTPETEDERAHNIKCCVRHLKAAGVNCGSFTAEDLTDGNMKTILSLFYSLSQFKRTTKSVAPDGLASRIARPVSPGLKHSHRVSSGTPPQTTVNGIASGSGMGGASKSTISPSTNRRTAGSCIVTSTVDKSYGARRITPFKNLVLSGENPAPLGETGTEGEGEDGSKLHGSLSAGGSTSRLDHMTTKSSIPGVNNKPPSPMDSQVSMSQPNLHRIPIRSKSDPRLGQRAHRKEHASLSDATNTESSNSPGKTSPGPKRMLKQPSTGNMTSRSPSQEHAMPGRTTPSRLARPVSRLNKTGGDHKVAMVKETSEENEVDHLKFERKRSNSDAKRPSALSLPRSLSRTGGEMCGGPGIPIPGGHPSGKGSTPSPDSRLISSSSVPSGDGIRQVTPSSEKERSFTTSDPGTPVSTTKRLVGGASGLQTPTRHKLRTSSASSQASIESDVGVPSSEQDVVGGREEVKERPASKLTKPVSLQRFGAAGRKSPSRLTKFQSMSSQGSVPMRPKTTAGRSGEPARVERGGGERREGISSSNSSLEGSANSEHDVKPVKSVQQVSSTSVTGLSTQSEHPKQVSSLSGSGSLVAPLVGGKDNRRISPEGMSPNGKTLSNESISSENRLNQQDKPDLKTKLIEEVAQSTEVVGTAVMNGSVGSAKMGGDNESETQTSNLSQGSEAATDTTLSSLSLSSGPHTTTHTAPLPATGTTCEQQPETGQAPYSDSASPHTKHKSHDSHMTPEKTQTQNSHESRHFNPLSNNVNPMRSPLTREKEKAKRARSLSPKISRRIFPLPSQPNKPAVNVSQYDTSGSLLSPPASTSERFGAHLELSRTDSPESVKSDIVTSAYALSRKPLRSSLRATRDKDSSSSSLDSGKVHLLTNKVTISPRSSQVVFLPDEAGLQLSATYSQPTILSPAKRLLRGRPSSLSDNCSVVQDPEKRGSIFSEKMDYSDEEKFLSAKLSHDVSHQRYDSTPELLQTFENELSTMKKDLANKDRMLSMYENSMADLSSKVHHLKKTLEEKDQEIRHLTEEKQTLFDLDGRSLASRMSTMTTEVLSDGCLSDSAMEPGRHGHKGDEKKKRKWKRWSFRKKKDIHDMNSALDTESIISSGRSLSAIKRHPNKSKSDLMSISEYAPDVRMTRDVDAKSYISDYNNVSMPYSNDDVITVYDDPMPGAKAPVTLVPGYTSNVSYRGSEEEEGWRGGGGGGEEGEGTIVLGTVSIAPEISWITMDTKICDIFMHHINSLDSEGNLSLSEDSILHYFIADQRREIGNALLPPLTPYQSLATGTTVRIVLRGALQGSCDAVAYKLLISADTLQSYVSLLMETQWLVIMGTKGTCKTSLALGLSQHLMQIVGEGEEGEEGEEGGGVVIINYNVERDGLETVLADMKNNVARKIRMWPHPPIITMDNIYECSVLEQILTTASNLPRRPYIIATLCTATMQGVPLHQLLFHHQMRVVTCNPQTEPVSGILYRSLRKQVYKLKAARIEVDPVVEQLVQWLPYLLEHLDAFINRFHTQTVSLGPRVFMDCAVDQNRDELETWFINLWNHFVIPYLMGAIMAGIETYTADPQLEWVDVREFVVEVYPWQPSINVMKLRTLNPDDVGWNHAVRPQQNRFMLFKDDMKLPDDTRSLLSRIKPE